MWRDSFVCEVIHPCVTRLVHLWLTTHHTTHTYTWHDSSTCDAAHSYLTWPIHVWHDTFMTHSYVTWIITRLIYITIVMQTRKSGQKHIPWLISHTQTHAHTHSHTHTYARAHVRAHTPTDTHTHRIFHDCRCSVLVVVCLYVYMYACKNLYSIYVRMCCTRVRVWVCVCVYVKIYFMTAYTLCSLVCAVYTCIFVYNCNLFIWM